MYQWIDLYHWGKSLESSVESRCTTCKRHTFGRVAFGGHLSIGLPEDACGSQGYSQECICMHGKYDWEASDLFGMIFYAKERSVYMMFRTKRR